MIVRRPLIGPRRPHQLFQMMRGAGRTRHKEGTQVWPQRLARVTGMAGLFKGLSLERHLDSKKRSFGLG